MLLGDSLTQFGFSPGGWAGRLANRYQRRADVLNRGYSGYNTRWILEHVRRDTGVVPGGGATKLVTCFFGANDASLPEHNLRQHVPLEE